MAFFWFQTISCLPESSIFRVHAADFLPEDDHLHLLFLHPAQSSLKGNFSKIKKILLHSLSHCPENKEKGSKSQDLTLWSSRTKKSKTLRIVVSFFWHSYVLRLRSKINVFNICADLPPRLVVTPPLSQSLEKAQWWEKKIENLVYVKSTYFFGVQEAGLLSNFFICQ